MPSPATLSEPTPSVTKELHAVHLGDPDLLYQAARVLGPRCQDGVPLCSVPPHQWWTENGVLHIPFPGSPTRFPAPPDRRDLETALDTASEESWISSCSSFQQLRALMLFSRSLRLPASDLVQWRKTFLHQQQSRTRNHLRQEYRILLQANRQPAVNGIQGVWNGETALSVPELLSEVSHSLQHPQEVFKRGARATLWRGNIRDEDVIIKRYEPNPRPWRRPLEICRASRAWAGALLLKRAGIAVPDPLGWVEVLSGPDKGTSVFISKPLPPSETVRVWLRRQWGDMDETQRLHFRHRLRAHLLEMYSNGLVHLDCKLSNLRVVIHPDPSSLTFIWTDLEDIRPQAWLGRSFLRNLYQLNGSLPRAISRGERIQFLKGFRPLFPYAASSWVIRYVERVTRKRHLRELRRQRGA